MGKQTDNGRAFFLEQTRDGKFAVLEMEDEPGVTRPFKMPAHCLREADIVIHNRYAEAQRDITERRLSFLKRTNNTNIDKLETKNYG